MSKPKKPGKKKKKKKSASAPTAARLRSKAVASTAVVPNKTIVISANELRALAEAADGTRQTKMCFVESTDTKHPVKIDKNAGTTTVLIEVETKEKERFTTPAILSTAPVLDVYYDEDGNAVQFNMSECDAVFTSLSAVEKFLVPYYARMKTLDEVKKMRDKFALSTVTAAAFHLPSSYEGLAVAGGVVFATKNGETLEGVTFSKFIE